MESIDPRDLLIRVADILKKFEIPYVVTGGMAIYVWGRPRFTADIDIVVRLKAENIHILASTLTKLSEASYISQDMMKRAFERKGEFNFIDGGSGIKVDFWVVGDTPFEKEQINRGIPKRIKNTTVYFASPEDLILSKLLWYNESESSKQLEDVKSVITMQKKLDWKYLYKWAKEHSTLKVLEKLRKSKNL